MKRRFSLFFSLWGILLALMVAVKPLFMLIQSDYTSADMGNSLSVISHGLSMDISMSAYFVAPVALWIIASIWASGNVMRRLLRGYLWLPATILSAVWVIDAVLFPFWHFRLDYTPLFYFTTSPKAALASAPWWQEMLGVLIMVALAWLIYRLLRFVVDFYRIWDAPARKHRVWSTVAWVAVCAAMIIPIRGGVTVSTMSPGRVFFSNDMRLNQAALNPVFNFMHSLAHQDNLGSEMCFFDDKEADSIVSAMYAPAVADSLPEISLRVPCPDIYLIILESFSAHLMPSLGGEAVAMRLDSIAAEGILFTDFYAESFRTDRALGTILSGYPAMPTASLLKFADRFDKMPSLSRSLTDEGYECRYFYGGDINFTNQRGYLVTGGFSHIVSDKDYPITAVMSKWGAPDHLVYEQTLSDIDKTKGKPVFRVIQTSSSHEPYDVPFISAKFADNPKLNAFAYADSCLGAFIDSLKATAKWDNSLIAIVPDHFGVYPPHPDSVEGRHHVSFVLTGGAITGMPRRISATGSQSAIAPTLLALLNIDFSSYPNPQNLLDGGSHFAWMTDRDAFAIKLRPDAEATVLDAATGKAVSGDTTYARAARAFAQKAYHTLSRMKK